MSAPTPVSKPALRAWAREIRAALDLPPLSQALCERLASLPEFVFAENVLLYAALPGEIDVLSLAATPGKRFYLPRCAENRQLTIHEYPCSLVVSRYGIREPDAHAPETSPEKLDLVVVPGLAFTREGVRLGYGGGYYDRFLPKLRRECAIVGAAPDELVLESLPVDPWDFLVKILATPTEIFRGGA